MKVKFLKNLSIWFKEDDIADVLEETEDRYLVSSGKSEKVWVRKGAEGEYFEVVEENVE